ncbi:hypothetical protein [Deinococcus hopiensis]|uniref:Uncharacterized protein n=1 Tax=Deinococcus hopiensis KR-140 TaxID=695939 RepID=A0A1W1VSQ6_9DEIO|nr:hypothetical protein [Deinococcus hopiensis]SMB96260.1 hypothetical protein SAMN00790413_03227 [Deinococcus hopiensis KR-140]
MNPLHPLFRLALGSAATMSVLTACPRYTPPPMGPNLTFTFPAITDTTNVIIAAVAFEQQADETYKPKVVAQNPIGYSQGGPSNTTASLYYWGDAIGSLPNNAKCTTPFITGEASGKQEVTVTPNTVKTCNVYFSVYRDSNRNGTPESGEELYITHDIYSYASEAFSYRYVYAKDGNISTETGNRTQGWSVVRHQVLQPSATPGRYQITMNSVPAEDLGIAMRMHEDSNFFTSQSLTGGHK